MDLTKHKLLQDQVLILPISFQSTGSVKKAEQYEDKPEWGYVLSVGEGRLLENGTRDKIDLKHGDVVLFMAYGGTKVRALGVDFVYVRQEDIVSVYNS